MLRRLKIILILFVLLLMLERWLRRDEPVAGEPDHDSEWRPGGRMAVGDSIVLEQDAPILVAEQASSPRTEGSPAESAEADALETASPAAAKQDDLTVIEGIGNRITELLNGAGIRTFEQLAGAEPDRLREILQQAGLRMIDPSTWGEQAGLAARGDWDGLKELQSRLKAGRRDQ